MGSAGTVRRAKSTATARSIADFTRSSTLTRQSETKTAWRSTVVSCPGKVLLAGGYLVLDRAYSGLVVATASRFYTVVEGAAAGQARVIVRSPQFDNAVWAYDVADDGWVQAAQGTSDNPFVALAVSEALRLSRNLLGPGAFAAKVANGLRIAVLGDNDFYSQPRAATEATPFNALGVPISEANKTGLGSSAAMVTSLTAAIVIHMGALDGRDDATEVLQRLAQYVHSRAQGKVGSGFDVSAATYGSHVYTRFDPSCLAALLAGPTTGDQLRAAITESPLWSSLGATVKPFSLPPLTTLVLADVKAGSHTPSMVSKVLAWRKTCPQDGAALWRRIAGLNDQLAATFTSLAAAFAENEALYRQELAALASQNVQAVRRALSAH